MTVESADQLPNAKPSKSHLQSQPHHYHSSHNARYAKLHSNDVASSQYAPQLSFRNATDTCSPVSGGATNSMPKDSRPYGYSLPAATSSDKNTLGSLKVVIGKLGKKAAEATKKSQDYAGNMWQHLRTGPSVAEAAVGRIAQGTKVLPEGGYEKIFGQTFQTVPGEKLIKTYACYLSTSAGPVMGVTVRFLTKWASRLSGVITRWPFHCIS